MIFRRIVKHPTPAVVEAKRPVGPGPTAYGCTRGGQDRGRKPAHNPPPRGGSISLQGGFFENGLWPTRFGWSHGSRALTALFRPDRLSLIVASAHIARILVCMRPHISDGEEMSMTDFDDFIYLCQRFRIAGEINGCLWELVDQLRQSEGITHKYYKNRCSLVLRKLRSVLKDEREEQTPIESVARSEITRVFGTITVSFRGPAFTWLLCHPKSERRQECHGCPTTQRNQREAFREGEKARQNLLRRIGIEDLAVAQTKAVMKIRPQNSRDRMLQHDINELARSALAHENVEDTCYASATFTFLDKTQSMIEREKPETRSWDTIRKKIWRRCSGHSIARGSTLVLGRFGSRIRTNLRAMLEEPEPANKEISRKVKEEISRKAKKRCRGDESLCPEAIPEPAAGEEPLKESWSGHHDKPIGDSIRPPKHTGWELWEELEAIIRNYEPEDRDFIRGVLCGCEECGSFPKAIKEAAGKARLSAEMAQQLYARFQQDALKRVK